MGKNVSQHFHVVGWNNNFMENAKKKFEII